LSRPLSRPLPAPDAGLGNRARQTLATASRRSGRRAPSTTRRPASRAQVQAPRLLRWRAR